MSSESNVDGITDFCEEQDSRDRISPFDSNYDVINSLKYEKDWQINKINSDNEIIKEVNRQDDGTSQINNINVNSTNYSMNEETKSRMTLSSNLPMSNATVYSSEVDGFYGDLKQGYFKCCDDYSQRTNENLRILLKGMHSMKSKDINESIDSMTDVNLHYNEYDLDSNLIFDDNLSFKERSTDNEFRSSSNQNNKFNLSESNAYVITSPYLFTPNDNLFYFVINNDLDRIKLFMKSPEEKIKDYYGRNLFHLACCEGHYNMVEYLISIGYNVNNVIDNGDNETVLHVCVYYGYVDIMKLLLRNNIDLTIRGNNGSTAFHYTSIYNKLDILQYFIDNNIYDNIYETNKYSLNILLLACLNGYYKIMIYLLSIEYDINTTNNENQSALHFSVSKGHKRVVELLLNHNIDINVKESKYGRSALHFASYFNQLDILKYFIDNNIYNNIYDIDNDGNNIFHLSCLVGNYNIIEYLLSIGYNINTTNNENQSALHISVSEGHKRVVELLLNHNTDINIKESKYGRSALHFATEFNQLVILKYFIDKNIYNNIYDIDNNGNNIFHLSCWVGNYNIIEYLLSIGYDINTTNNDNWSALHISVSEGHKRVVELLLNHNTDINIKESKYGRSALLFASEFNQLDILAYFIDNNIYNNIYYIDNDGCNIFHLSCLKGNYNIIEYLLSIGYDINTTNNENESALHISVSKGHKRVIELLINHNIDINIKESKCGRSAFHAASECNQLDILKYFIDNNIYNNIYDIDNNGNNIFHLSCWVGNYNIIEYLLSIEYDINTTNNDNRSALHISVIKGHKRAVELLLNHNIDINIKESKYGRSAFHFASEFNQLVILKYFIDNNIYNNIYDIDDDGCNILHLSCFVGNYNIIEYLLSIGYHINLLIIIFIIVFMILIILVTIYFIYHVLRVIKL